MTQPDPSNVPLPTLVESAPAPHRSLTVLEWAIVAVACLGFAFDTYEIVILPLIARPAISTLGPFLPGTPAFNRWIGFLFFIPFLFGGLCGFFGGYLTDRVGRRRVLVWSILIYAASTWAAAYATSLPLFLLFRSTTIIGVCVEYVAAVAWLAELFPEPRQREAVLGYTQVASALGSFMVAGAFYVAATYGHLFPAILGAHETWRYALLFGTIPAIPLIIVRPFLPESPMWTARKARGTLKRARIGELFQPALARTTLISGLIVACGYAITFGGTQQIMVVVPDLPALAGRPGVEQEQAVSAVQFVLVIGNVIGRLLLAWLVVRIVQRRRLLLGFVAPGLLLPFMFIWLVPTGMLALSLTMFLASAIATAQYSFWGNYLPRVYPTRVRGTGESFAVNIGGRIFGPATAMLTTTLATTIIGATSLQRVTRAAAIVVAITQITAVLAIKWLPEPQSEELPE
ncbi:MAG TPA: MFS transporter [Gemmatimonadaceae bacterium]|nr:MFS transporter [Gemmatimonadaceae bacterium]